MTKKPLIKKSKAPCLLPPIQWKKLDGKIDIPPAVPPAKQLAEYPFDLMEVGDCVEINRDADRIRKSIWFYLNRAKVRGVGKFVVRKLTKESCRVWRTA